MNSCVVLNIFQLLECLQGDPKYLYTLITLIYLVKSDTMMENIKKKRLICWLLCHWWRMFMLVIDLRCFTILFVKRLMLYKENMSHAVDRAWCYFD